MISKILTLLFFCVVANLGYTQTQTIGLQKSSPLASEGYLLFSPEGNKKVYLINNCGEKVNDWTFHESPALTSYLLPNGNLLRAGKDSLEIRDWNNTKIWSYAMKTKGFIQHHDIHPLPNGNILAICSVKYDSLQSINAGRKPSLTTGPITFEKIIELKPIGLDSAELVWEWKFFDHLIQDFDATKNNFGQVENHPELLDVNANSYNNTDWIHLNSVSYNSNLDQIIISARHLSEIYIIDHSTTTAQAASHTGGNSNKGGDFLWRWGNPQVYKQGTSVDQKLFLQHDAKWIDSSYLDEGKISVFNNLGTVSGTYSSMDIIVPSFNNSLYAISSGKFQPLSAEFSWNGSVFGNTILEGKKSGWQSLPNGNMLIYLSSNGQVSEITKTGEHLWSYRNPASIVNTIFNQYDIVNPSLNSIFRAEKYPPNYSGFVGKSLTPKGIIEDQNSESLSCISLGVNTHFLQERIIIANPVTTNFIRFNQEVNLAQIKIYNTCGQLISTIANFNGDKLYVDLPSGSYFLTHQLDDTFGTQKIVVVK